MMSEDKIMCRRCGNFSFNIKKSDKSIWVYCANCDLIELNIDFNYDSENNE